MKNTEQTWNPEAIPSGCYGAGATRNRRRTWQWFLFLLYTLHFTLYTLLHASKETASFQNIGIGARALGMGCFTSIADDTSTIYWNPAGLDIISRQVLIMYTPLSLDTQQHFLSYSHPTKGVTYGIAWYRVTTKDIEKTDDKNILGNFNISSDIYFLSSGLTLIGPVSFGITGKIIKQNIDTFKADGAGVDLGLHISFDTVSFGLKIQDIGGTQIKGKSYWNSGTVKEVATPKLRFGLNWKTSVTTDLSESQTNNSRKTTNGISYHAEPNNKQIEMPEEWHKKTIYPVRNDKLPASKGVKGKAEPIKIDWIVGMDIESHIGKNNVTLYPGTEIWLNDSVAGRIGYSGGKGITAGGSFKWKYFQFDYAFIVNNALENTHQFAMNIFL